MNRRMAWFLGGVIALSAIGAAISWAQSDRPGAVDLETIYALLVTEDGQNRLDRMEATLERIEREVDLIHGVALRTLEEQYGFFAANRWTLDDITYCLDRFGLQLDQIRMKTDCIPCP